MSDCTNDLCIKEINQLNVKLSNLESENKRLKEIEEFNLGKRMEAEDLNKRYRDALRVLLDALARQINHSPIVRAAYAEAKAALGEEKL